jgi:hypothetical protein
MSNLVQHASDSTGTILVKRLWDNVNIRNPGIKRPNDCVFGKIKQHIED